jgi:hypothetical protein
MRIEVVNVHTAAAQQRLKLVYLKMLVVRVKVTTRFSCK